MQNIYVKYFLAPAARYIWIFSTHECDTRCPHSALDTQHCKRVIKQRLKPLVIDKARACRARAKIINTAAWMGSCVASSESVQQNNHADQFIRRDTSELTKENSRD